MYYFIIIAIIILFYFIFIYSGFSNLRPGDLWRVNNYRNIINAADFRDPRYSTDSVRINNYWIMDERDRMYATGYTPYDLILRDQLYRDSTTTPPPQPSNVTLNDVRCKCLNQNVKHISGNNYMQDHLMAGVDLNKLI